MKKLLAFIASLVLCLGVTAAVYAEGPTPVASEQLDAVETALQCSFKHEAIVEEFIEGWEISVEFISYQGKHYPLQITDKVTTGAPHFVELEHHQPAELSDNQYKEIYALTVRVSPMAPLILNTR